MQLWVKRFVDRQRPLLAAGIIRLAFTSLHWERQQNIIHFIRMYKHIGWNEHPFRARKCTHWHHLHNQRHIERQIERCRFCFTLSCKFNGRVTKRTGRFSSRRCRCHRRNSSSNDRGQRSEPDNDDEDEEEEEETKLTLYAAAPATIQRPSLLSCRHRRCWNLCWFCCDSLATTGAYSTYSTREGSAMAVMVDNFCCCRCCRCRRSTSTTAAAGCCCYYFWEEGVRCWFRGGSINSSRLCRCCSFTGCYRLSCSRLVPRSFGWLVVSQSVVDICRCPIVCFSPPSPHPVLPLPSRRACELRTAALRRSLL